MFKELIHFFKKKENKKMEKNMKEDVKNKLKSFDIIVYTPLDDYGKVSEHPENGVKAYSASQLVSLYSACGQKIKILKEYMSEEQKENLEQRKIAEIEKKFKEKNEENKENSENIVGSSNFSENTITRRHQIENTMLEDKLFNVGGVNLKFSAKDNCLYENKWVKISEEELHNFRLISKKTGKEVSMVDKSLEVLRWVKVEEDNK